MSPEKNTEARTLLCNWEISIKPKLDVVCDELETNWTTDQAKANGSEVDTKTNINAERGGTIRTLEVEVGSSSCRLSTSQAYTIGFRTA